MTIQLQRNVGFDLKRTQLSEHCFRKAFQKEINFKCKVLQKSWGGQPQSLHFIKSNYLQG